MIAVDVAYLFIGCCNVAARSTLTVTVVPLLVHPGSWIPVCVLWKFVLAFHLPAISKKALFSIWWVTKKILSLVLQR